MRVPPGKCPYCHAAGPAGQLCFERICGELGYHAIPLEYFERIAELTIHRRNPNIGIAIGDYLIVDEIGQGAFGDVFLALQLPVMLKGALKLMSPKALHDENTGAALLDKFEGEAWSLAQLTHPNIVRLLKYGMHNEMPYIVMEYVDNAATLKQEMLRRVNNRTPFTIEEVRDIVGQILSGLNSAHARKIIHRDIKPENVMLQRLAGGEVHVRILDFGLSKFIEESTGTSLIAGTPTYMATEQITGRNIGPWTDLYAVGAIAFEMLTGRRAFSGKSKPQIFADKLDDSYDPVNQLESGDFPKQLKDFFRTALANDLAERFQSVAEFRTAFRKLLNRLEGEWQASYDPDVFDKHTTQDDSERSWIKLNQGRKKPLPPEVFDAVADLLQRRGAGGTDDTTVR